MTEGKYLYCIVSESEEKSFSLLGINNQAVSLVHYKDIAAAISPTAIINFDRFAKEDFARFVATHQRVNEFLMKDYDVVPMTFGIIAQNQDEVLRILEKVYLQFKMALQKIAGKIEFAVQIFWDEKKILEELVNQTPEIQELKEKAQSLLGIGAKLKLGKLVFETLENKRKEYLQDIEDALKERTLESRPGKLLDKTMIGNISFLIEKVAEPEFDKRMQALGEEYGDNLRFKYVGPMPPYSFVNINLSLGNFEAVDEARKLLGLTEITAFDEIKKAYYALSHQYHPDRHQGTEEQMRKITQAYSILENYCQSCDEFTPTPKFDAGVSGKGKIQKYSFKKEDVENSLIIK